MNGKYAQQDKRVSGDLVWRWISVFAAEDMQVNSSWHTCWRRWQKRLKSLFVSGQYQGPLTLLRKTFYFVKLYISLCAEKTLVSSS